MPSTRETAASTTPTTTPAAPTLGDLPCVACGYNLRGLDPAGRCPECGAAVAPSLSQNPFANADPRWLRRVALGVTLFNLIHAYTFLVYVSAFRGMFRFGALTPPSDLALVAVVIATVSAAGAYLLSTPEPAARRNGRAVRIALRVVAVAWATIITAWAVLPVVAPRSPADVPVAIETVVIPLLVIVLGLNALHALVRGLGDTRLAVQMRVVGLSYVLLLGATHPLVVEAYNWIEFVPRAVRLTLHASVLGAWGLCVVWTAFLSGRIRQALPVRPRGE